MSRVNFQLAHVVVVCVCIGLVAGNRGLAQTDVAAGQTYFYGASAAVEQRMEIYFPPHHDPAKVKAPVMILFHGGNWEQGSLDQFRFACAYFASRGVVAATADYRMLDKAGRSSLSQGESPKEVCVSDARSAIRWLVSHAAELGIDAQRLIVGGGSAGGHISAIATMNSGPNALSGAADMEPRVAAYIWFNPAFSPEDSKHPKIDILTHIKADLPPSLVFFGDQDDAWLPGWKTAYARWKELGVTNIEYWIAPGQKHAFFNSKTWRSITLRAADNFLVRHGLVTGESTLPSSPPDTGLVPGDPLR